MVDNLNDQIIFRFQNVSSYFIHQIDESAKKYNLTGTQWMIINEVGKNKSITMHDLAEKFYLSKANLSAIIKRLQVNNIIAKERSTLDQRYVYIQLTEKGNKIYHNIEKDMKSHNDIWDELNESEENKILESLEILEKLIVKYEENDKQESK